MCCLHVCDRYYRKHDVSYRPIQHGTRGVIGLVIVYSLPYRGGVLHPPLRHGKLNGRACRPSSVLTTLPVRQSQIIRSRSASLPPSGSATTSGRKFWLQPPLWASPCRRLGLRPSAVRLMRNHRPPPKKWTGKRSEEHTSELQSLMRTSYAVFRC